MRNDYNYCCPISLFLFLVVDQIEQDNKERKGKASLIIIPFVAKIYNIHFLYFFLCRINARKMTAAITSITLNQKGIISGWLRHSLGSQEQI